MRSCVVGCAPVSVSYTHLDVYKRQYIWGRKKSQLALMEETRENPHYLPGIKLPRELKMIHDMKTALKDASIVVFAVPAQNFRKVFEEAVVYMPSDAVAVNVAKGIEKGSLMRLSQIAMQIKTCLLYTSRCV